MLPSPGCLAFYQVGEVEGEVVVEEKEKEEEPAPEPEKAE